MMWGTESQKLQKEELSEAEEVVRNKLQQLSGFIRQYADARIAQYRDEQLGTASRDAENDVQDIALAMEVCIRQLIAVGQEYERKVITYEVACNAIRGKVRW